MSTAAYRVRIADPGAATVDGNVALTLTDDDLVGVPVLSGPKVDPLKCQVTSVPFQIEGKNDSVMFTSSGRMTGLGRLVEVARALDGAAYAEVGTGRLDAVTESAIGNPVLRVADERWVERKTEIFRLTDTVQLHPPGLASAWLDEPAAGTATYIVKEVSGSAVRIGPNDEKGDAAIREVPAGLRQALATDLVAPDLQVSSASNSDGNFTNLRFETGGVDRKVIGFKRYLSTRGGGITFAGLLAGLSPVDGAGSLEDAWVYIPGHSLNVDDPVTGRFYWPDGVAINEKVPLHIGGADGVHPWVLGQAVLDGDYGGQAVRYPSAVMTALQALPLRPVWARIPAPAERSAWMRENVYKLTGCPPLVGTDLQLRPTSLRLPLDVDPDTLPVLTALNSSEYSWGHTSGSLATVVEFRCRGARKLSKVTSQTDDRPADFFELVKIRVPDIEHDTVSTLSEQRHKIDTVLILDRPARWSGEVDRIARELSTEIFDVFGDGPQAGACRAPDNSGLEVGDLAVVDHDSIKGFNADTGDRSGQRVVLLVAFRGFEPASLVFEYLDLGPKSAPLAAPTVAITQDGTDPDLANVEISNLPAGATATVECTAAASAPSAYDLVRSKVGNETISFRIDAGGGNAYARAYSTAPNRIRSAYATDSVALSNRPLVTSMKVEIVGKVATVTWEVSSNTSGMRTRYAIHRRGKAVTLANQTDYDSDDGGFTVTLGARDSITVELVPYTGWTGSAVSGTAGDATVGLALYPEWAVYDLPPVAIRNATADWEKDGSVSIGASLDGMQYLRVAVSTSAFPSEATVDAASAQAVDSTGWAEVAFAGPYNLDQELFISLKGYEFETVADGNDSAVMQMVSRRQDTSVSKTMKLDSAAFQINDLQYTDVAWVPKYVSPTGTLARTLFAVAPIPIGATVTEVRFYLYMTNTGDSFVGHFYSVDDDLTTGVNTVGSDSLTGVTGHQTVTLSSLDEEITTDDAYKLQVQLTNDATFGDIRFGYAEIDYDVPTVEATL